MGSQNIGFWDLAVLEDQLAGSGTPNAKFIQFGSCAEPLHPFLNEESGDTVLRLCIARVSLGISAKSRVELRSDESAWIILPTVFVTIHNSPIYDECQTQSAQVLALT